MLHLGGASHLCDLEAEYDTTEENRAKEQKMVLIEIENGGM